jgi:hypothetical protein
VSETVHEFNLRKLLILRSSQASVQAVMTGYSKHAKGCSPTEVCDCITAAATCFTISLDLHLHYARVVCSIIQQYLEQGPPKTIILPMSSSFKSSSSTMKLSSHLHLLRFSHFKEVFHAALALFCLSCPAFHRTSFPRAGFRLTLKRFNRVLHYKAPSRVESAQCDGRGPWFDLRLQHYSSTRDP